MGFVPGSRSTAILTPRFPLHESLLQLRRGEVSARRRVLRQRALPPLPLLFLIQPQLSCCGELAFLGGAAPPRAHTPTPPHPPQGNPNQITRV